MPLTRTCVPAFRRLSPTLLTCAGALSLLLLTSCASRQEIAGNPPAAPRAVSREEMEAASAPGTRPPLPPNAIGPREEKRGFLSSLWPFGGGDGAPAPAPAPQSPAEWEPRNLPPAARTTANAAPASAPVPTPTPVPEEKRPGLFQRAIGVIPFVGGGDSGTGQAGNEAQPAPTRQEGPSFVAKARSKDLRGLELRVTTEPASPRVSQDRRIHVVIALVNTGKRSVNLRFGSTQSREILIHDARGAILTRWSEDYVFEQALTTLVVNPGERVQYKETISTRDLAANREYTLDVGILGYSDLQVSAPFRTLP